MNTETKPAVVSKPRRATSQFSARERAQAVLSIWTERRRPSEVCRELGVTGTLLSQWQDRALGAILAAMEPRTRPAQARPPALSEKLLKLLSRQERQQAGKLSRLEKRLEQIQEKK